MPDTHISPTVSMYAGAIIGGMGALSVTEWMAILGFCLALAGFCVNTWHKISSYRLQKRKTLAEVAEIEARRK